MDVLSKLKEIVTNITETEHTLTDQMRFSELDIDSMDSLMILNEIEIEFGITLNDNELLKDQPISDLLSLIKKEHEQRETANVN